MTSALQDIADTMATDFRDAVMDAEKEDYEAMGAVIREIDLAYNEYFNKEALLQTKQEQAVRTIMEIADLRDLNKTSHERRIKALREQLAILQETKAPKMATLPATPGIRLVDPTLSATGILTK